LGQSRPKRDWADLGPTKSPIFFWAGPGPDSRNGPESVWPITHGWARTILAQRREKTNNAGPKSAWPSNITNREGIIFPPLFLHAERYSFCMQERKGSKRKQ